MFNMTGNYTAQVKVWINNTWDWMDIELRKSDIDYIRHHCKDRKECVPVLRKRHRSWYLDFAFEENVKLPDARLKTNSTLLLVQTMEQKASILQTLTDQQTEQMEL